MVMLNNMPKGSNEVNGSKMIPRAAWLQIARDPLTQPMQDAMNHLFFICNDCFYVEARGKLGHMDSGGSALALGDIEVPRAGKFSAKHYTKRPGRKKHWREQIRVVLGKANWMCRLGCSSSRVWRAFCKDFSLLGGALTLPQPFVLNLHIPVQLCLSLSFLRLW